MQQKRSVNMLTLKVIAAVTMTVDHVGALFFPGQMYWRCIGRLAFPIFCFMIANGFFYTRSKVKYLIRLVICAFLSQLPFIAMYWLEHGQPETILSIFSSPQQFFVLTFVHLNSIFTLSFGLVALVCLELIRHFFAKKQQPVLGVILGCVPAAGLVWVCIVLQCDYSILGVPLMVGFYAAAALERSDPESGNAKVAFWTLPILAIFVYMLTRSISSALPMRQWIYGLCQGLAMVPIAMYHGNPGPRHKALQYGFYLFYPVHMAVLVLLKVYI